MKRTFNLLILMTLIALAFSTLGVTSAQAGKSSAPSAAPITVLWSDNFESGYANWTMDGLWNAESDSNTCGSSKAPFPNPSNAAYYGLDGLCHYSTGLTNSGSLTMVNPVVLPGSGTLGMNFLNYQMTENSCGFFDLRLVDISTNGAGGPWTTLANLCTEYTWHTASVDLSAYAGQSIHIRFRFDTVDNFANGNFGWMVDNVEIYIVGAPPTDTTPPVVTVPADITEEATSASGAVVTFSVSATDETSPANPSVTCVPASGDTFPLGTTPVTCSAMDDAGNIGYGYFNVTVVDTTLPDTFLDTTPPALTNSTSATFTFHGTDNITLPANLEFRCVDYSNPVWVVCNSGWTLTGLTEGLHTVGIAAVDESANWDYPDYAIYSWTVDLTAPSLGLVADNPYEATGPGGANAGYTALYTDDNGIASQSCSPASGSLFPIGVNAVMCSATDNAGNSTGHSFNIIVVDTTAPTLNLPADITVPQVIPAGAVVTYTASANDLVDGAVAISCLPASGSTFPVGTTTVNCSATDSRNNTSSGSFDITVTAAANLLQKGDFGGAYVFPFPWIPSGFRRPYGGAIDCNYFLSGPCSARFNASDRNLALAALQRVARPGGLAGDAYSFGIYSAAKDAPNNGLYRVEITFFNGYRKLATYVVNLNPGTHGFELGSSVVNAPANYTRIDFRFVYQKVAGTAWFDDAFLYLIP